MNGLNPIPGLECCPRCTNFVEDCDCCHECGGYIDDHAPDCSRAEQRVSMVVESKRAREPRHTLQGLGLDQTIKTPSPVIRVDSSDGLEITNPVRKKAG